MFIISFSCFLTLTVLFLLLLLFMLCKNLININYLICNIQCSQQPTLQCQISAGDGNISVGRQKWQEVLRLTSYIQDKNNYLFLQSDICEKAFLEQNFPKTWYVEGSHETMKQYLSFYTNIFCVFDVCVCVWMKLIWVVRSQSWIAIVEMLRIFLFLYAMLYLGLVSVLLVFYKIWASSNVV